MAYEPVHGKLDLDGGSIMEAMAKSRPKPKSLHSRIFDPEKSSLRKYQEAVIGNQNLFSLMKYEVIITTLSWMPGALGIILRKHIYKYLFKQKVRNVIFGKNIDIACPDRIAIGRNCLIGDACLLDAKGENGGICIGDNVQIARNTLLRSKEGSIWIGNNTTVSSFCHISSVATRVSIGENVIIASYCYIIGGGGYGFDRVDIAIKDQARFGKGIVIEDDIWLGAGVYVIDGTKIGTGSVIGAGSVVTHDIPEYSVAVGVPARVVRRRKG